MNPFLLGILIIAMTVMGAFGSFFLKRASASNGIRALAVNYNFYLGGAIYASSAVINIIVLRFLPYSVVLPLTSMTYMWTLLIGWLLLKEKLTFRSVAGVLLIISGVTILVA